MQLTFRARAEQTPGPKWQAEFDALWPAYRRWFERGTATPQPSLMVSRRRLGEYMPELLPVFDKLLELAGGDPVAGRFLSCYRPPRYLAACSQAAWQRSGEHVLVRNYDLEPGLHDGLIYHSRFAERAVIANSEFFWGVADGMNDSGLAVSLAFGGSQRVGRGFGLPLILRYVLEVCDNVEQGIAVLRRVPSHMAYNVTLLDSSGTAATVEVAPGKESRVCDLPVATNHQYGSRPDQHARFTRSHQRERRLRRRLDERDITLTQFVQGFLEPPMYVTDYPRGFGTLYTAVYRPAEGVAEWHWPHAAWRQSFGTFNEGECTVRYSSQGADVLPLNAQQASTRGISRSGPAVHHPVRARSSGRI